MSFSKYEVPKQSKVNEKDVQYNSSQNFAGRLTINARKLFCNTDVSYMTFHQMKRLYVESYGLTVVISRLWFSGM